MKDEDDWGPADYWSEGQMYAGIVFLVIVTFIATAWVIAKLF